MSPNGVMCRAMWSPMRFERLPSQSKATRAFACSGSSPGRMRPYPSSTHRSHPIRSLDKLSLPHPTRTQLGACLATASRAPPTLGVLPDVGNL
jgi:hypothetical protein